MNLQNPAHFVGLIPMILAAACLATDLPPASIGPALETDTNPPMVAKNATGVLGTIERLDPAVDKLLPADAKVEILVDGVDWAEGPIWFHEGLNFSDVKQNTMYRWTPEKASAFISSPAATPGPPRAAASRAPTDSHSTVRVGW